MADVFISYSRKDADFVRRLHDGLTAQKRDVWVDWNDIPVTAEWWREVQAGIDSADSVLFVMSPDSLASKVCGEELAYAVQQHKRLVPIVYRDVGSQSVPDALGRHNWLFMRDSDDFAARFGTLVHALDTDLDYVKAHTRLLTRAVEWQARKDDSPLLRGRDLRDAEVWLLGSGSKEPHPSPLQQEYIFASRRAANARSRLLLAGVAAAAAIALVLAVIAFIQRGIAEEQRGIADEQRAIAYRRADEAGSLAQAFGARQALGAGNGDLALALAVAANRIDAPPELVGATLGEAAYGVGTRRLFAGAHNGFVEGMALSADGTRMLTGALDGTLALWDTDSGELLQQATFGEIVEVQGINLNADGINAIAFHPLEPSLAVIGGGAVVFWDVEEWREVARVTEFPDSTVNTLAFLPDGSGFITGYGNGSVVVWDARFGEALLSFQAHDDAIDTMAISPDGLWLATGGRDNIVRMWNLQGGRRAWEAEAPREGDAESDVNALAFMPNGETLLMGHDGTMLVEFNVENGDEVRRLPVTTLVTQLAVSPDSNTIVYSGANSQIHLLNAATGIERRMLLGHGSRISNLAFSADGVRLFSASDDLTIRSWNIRGGALERYLTGYADGAAVVSVTGLPEGRVLTGGGFSDPRVLLWQEGRVALAMDGHDDSVLTLAALPNNQALSGGFDGVVNQWDLDNGALLETYHVDDYFVITVDANAAGTQALVAAASDNVNRAETAALYLFDLTGGESRSFPYERGVFTYAATYAADETRAFVSVYRIFDEVAYIAEVDLATGAEVRRLPLAHSRPIYALAVSEDGTRLASSDENGLIIIWDVASGAEVQRLVGHSDVVRGLAFDPAGRLLISGSNDNTARVWDTQTWEELLRLDGHTDDVRGVAFSVDGQQALTAGRDGRLGVWNVSLDPAALRDYIARERFLRELTCAEREQYDVQPLCGA
jgi:WD40 repeat protein